MGNLFSAVPSASSPARAEADVREQDADVTADAVDVREQTTMAPLLVAQMDPDVLAFLQEDTFCQASPEQLTELDYRRNVDYPQLPEHVYFEGCFHGLKQSKPTESMHPRLGYDVAKAASTRRVRAFLAAVRQCNRGWLMSLASRLPKSKEGLLVRRLIKEGKVFGDVAIQMHAGDPVRPGDLAWHMDAANSILHLALSLRGSRTLHAKPGMGRADTDHEFPQEPGSVYLSTPFTFMHSVEYHCSKEDYDDRIVAVQCRFLCKFADIATLHSSGDFCNAIMKIVHDHLRHNTTLTLPNLDQVKEALKSLPK
eukprot:m.485875 g.485875  ORF g.485875 m.485875 type:complete len:311 (-) comp24052_c0_seq1:88-1020(-)